MEVNQMESVECVEKEHRDGAENILYCLTDCYSFVGQQQPRIEHHQLRAGCSGDHHHYKLSHSLVIWTPKMYIYLWQNVFLDSSHCTGEFFLLLLDTTAEMNLERTGSCKNKNLHPVIDELLWEIRRNWKIKHFLFRSLIHIYIRDF